WQRVDAGSGGVAERRQTSTRAGPDVGPAARVDLIDRIEAIAPAAFADVEGVVEDAEATEVVVLAGLVVRRIDGTLGHREAALIPGAAPVRAIDLADDRAVGHRVQDAGARAGRIPLTVADQLHAGVVAQHRVRHACRIAARRAGAPRC